MKLKIFIKYKNKSSYRLVSNPRCIRLTHILDVEDFEVFLGDIEKPLVIVDCGDLAEGAMKASIERAWHEANKK